MTAGVANQRLRDEQFWKDLSSMTDYFSPAVSALQEYLGVGSKEIMFYLGEFLGEKAGRLDPESSTLAMLDEFVAVWSKYGIGTLRVESTDPLTLVLSDCRICGQLPGTGDLYECVLHEGFFQGALSVKLGKPVEFRQEASYEGTSGTWCRRLVADIKVC